MADHPMQPSRTHVPPAGRRETTSPGLSRRDLLRGAGVAGGLAVTPIAALLSACEGASSRRADPNSERARTVVFDHHGGRLQAPELWNPLVTGFVNNAGFHQALAEPLFILNLESGEIEPWLGRSFTPNKAMDVWTLEIRDDITWSDGERYDADDIVFTIELLLDNVELTNAPAMQEWVERVRVVDATTVEFTLKKPNPRFQLDYFAVKIHSSLVILPEHIWADKDPLEFTNYDPKKGWPVFTGPYRLTSVSPTRVTYERHDDWWGAKAGFKPLPKPEKLEWVVHETEEVRVARAAEHQLDSVGDLTAGAFESLKGRADTFVSWLPEKPYAWPDPCTRLLSVNNALEPWNDPEMRWALNYAIDREEVVRIAYEGTTTPARFFFPDYPPIQRYVDLLEEEGLFEEFPILRHDPDEAQRIIESKGYTRGGGYYRKDGKELRLRIDAPSDFIEIWRYAEVLAEQLQRVGINATFRKLAMGTWGENMGNGDYEAVADWSACGSVNEPWYSMSLFHARHVVPVGESADSNRVRWKNDTYSRHVDAMAQLPLEDPRIDRHFVAAAREWLRELPFLPIAHARKLFAFDTTYWTGWPTKRGDNYLQPTLDWANAHKIIHNLRPVNR